MNLAAISDSGVNSRIVDQQRETQELLMASASPRRKELLARLSLPFKIIESGVEEDVLRERPPGMTALELAVRKAEAVARSRTRDLVLAADTVIDYEGTLLGKPEDSEHAKKMLRLLKGRVHDVLTGLAVVCRGAGIQLTSVVSTEVRMRDYDEREIEEYVAGGEPFGKAGSYAIQGEGSRLIESIRGCYNNVVGLPLCETTRLLQAAGLKISAAPWTCQSASGVPCPRMQRVGRQ